MENQSICSMSANIISPCNHIISGSVSARRQGNQSLGCLHIFTSTFIRDYLVQKITAAIVLLAPALNIWVEK